MTYDCEKQAGSKQGAKVVAKSRCQRRSGGELRASEILEAVAGTQASWMLRLLLEIAEMN